YYISTAHAYHLALNAFPTRRSSDLDYKAKQLSCAGKAIKEGEVITIDGSTGEVFIGTVPTIQPELTGDFGTLMEWADAIRKLRVDRKSTRLNSSHVKIAYAVFCLKK